jgi:uncharacterized protein (TIGR02996 family)
MITAANDDDDAVEEGFLARLRARPDDDDNRLVYADWLEERGHVEQSEFLRLQTSLKATSTEDPSAQRSSVRLRELALRVDQEWRTVVARAPIEHCETRFDFVCPKKWEALEPTAKGDDVRFCKSCEMDVYYSKTLQEAWEHAGMGRCVVVDLVQLRRPNDLPPLRSALPAITPMPMMAGAIAPPPGWNPQVQPPIEPPEPPTSGVPLLLSRVKKAIFDR